MPPNPRISKAQYLSSDFTLPPRHQAHDVIKYQMFEWSLLPQMPPDQKRIVMKCTQCSKKYYFGWERNWTTLKQHYNSVHNLTMERIKMEAMDSPTPDEWTIIGSSLIGPSGVYKGVECIDEAVTNGTSALSFRRNGRKRGPICVSFDQAEYEQLMLMMIVRNNLPFSLVESESFRKFLSFLRDDVSPVSQLRLNSRLEHFFEADLQKLKKKLDVNTSKFSMTIRKCRRDDTEFLVITLYFYNDQFEMEKYTIGLEELNGQFTYTGEGLYEFMVEILKKYGIEKRILAITRDNAGPMDVMMNKFKYELSVLGTEFDGDIWCMGHVLNLSAEVLLNYTFFKENVTQEFENFTKTVLDAHPEFGETVHRMKHLPRIMRLIILQINYSQKMKKRFKELVEARIARDPSYNGPEKMVEGIDARGVSTYCMIDHFIHFQYEITMVLRLTHGDFLESTADIEKFQLTTKDWDYLKTVRDLLQVFRAPTLSLQASPYPAINQTIPLIHGAWSILNILADDVRQNPLIAFGLQEARKKLLEYYPLHDETITSNKMLYLAIVLDPRYKLAVFESVGFSPDKISAIKQIFLDVYYEYKKDLQNSLPDRPVYSAVEPPAQPKGFSFVEEKACDDKEFEKYFAEPREIGSQDVISFFNIYKSRFPIISRMARDYFAVAAMSTPSVFSEALSSRIGNTATTAPGRLSRSMKMLALLKSWGVITTDEMADEEMDEYGKNMDTAVSIRVDLDAYDTGLVLDDDC